MSALPFDPHRLADAAGSLITNCRELAHLGLTPATSSNFSQRLDAQQAQIDSLAARLAALEEDASSAP